MASLKPLLLYGENLLPPNPIKVQFVLRELGLPYDVKEVAMGDVKGPEYLAVNPNGRLPTLYDPNKDFTIWESGAIIQYLVSEYDTEHKISFPDRSKEAYLANQWLHFQMSGQGPYYGQAVFFQRYHPEKLPSAIERYQKEARRVTSVLNTVLADKEYLVGGRFSYADLAFIPWQINVALIDTSVDWDKEAPHVAAWLKRMEQRPEIKDLLDKRAEDVKKAYG